MSQLLIETYEYHNQWLSTILTRTKVRSEGEYFNHIKTESSIKRICLQKKTTL